MHTFLFDSFSPRSLGPTTALDFTEQFARGIGPAPVTTSMMRVNGLYDMGATDREWFENEDVSNKATRDNSWCYGAAAMKSDHPSTKRRDMAAAYIGFRFVRDG